MANFFGIPRQRLPIAVAMVIFLAFTLSWLQGKFDTTDAKKAISLAMAFKPDGKTSVLELLAARGEGDPRCDGKVVSQLLGDVAVTCSTPGKPQVDYQLRVLLDGNKPPRPANPAAEALFVSH